MAKPIAKDLGATKIGEVVIKSGEVYVGDGQMAPFEPALPVTLPLGTYEIWLNRFDYEGDGRSSAMRAIRAGAVAERGKQLGESLADTGTQGICDLVAMREIAESIGAVQFSDNLVAEWTGDDVAWQPDPNREDMLVFASSGFGDGDLPVYELVHDGAVVGIEIEMIGPDEEYPF